MTSKRDDHDIDDAALDAFLRGEDELSALLAGLDQPAVPAALDARIHADARAALQEPVGAANDAQADTVGVAPTSAHTGTFLRRWRAPLGLAATVVLGVSLGVRWDGWRDETPRSVSDMAPVPAPAMKSDAGLAAPPPSPDAPQLENRHATQAAVLQPARAAQPTTPPEHAALVATPDAALPPPPPPVPALPSPPSTEPLTTMHRSRRAAPPLMPDFAPPAPAPAPAVSAPQMPDAAPSPPATPAPELARLAAPAPAAMPAPADADLPQARLAIIADLLDRGDVAAARAAWTRFHATYPDYPVPPPLQARIDTLAPAPDPDRR